MSQPPFEQAGSLRIGTVGFVSPDDINVVLDIETPESVAINAGAPLHFPRVNSYLLIPVDGAYLVGQVEWITVENSPFPKRRGMQDFGLIDLPYPLRKLRLNPLGTLRRRSDDEPFVFQRGADALPTVGASVVLPTAAQLRAIVESGEQRRVKIGSSALAGDAAVFIDPDRLFGRHLAVLGNTGSGKSCSVAGLIRWSLEQAAAQSRGGRPNARFIILDPNGEYARAFGDDGIATARVFKVRPDDHSTQLTVPLWFWNSDEWSSFARASSGVQQPLLRRALREIKAGRSPAQETTIEERELGLRKYLSSRLIAIRAEITSGSIQTNENRFGYRLKAMKSDLEMKQAEFPEVDLSGAVDALSQASETTYNSFPQGERTVEYYRAFTEGQVRAIVDAVQESLDGLGGIVYQEGPDEHIPLPYKGADLADHLEIIASQESASQYLEFLIARIRTFLSDRTLTSIIDNDDGMSLSEWLQDYLGENDADQGSVTVIDLSLVPSEVVHIVAAVTARMIFDALQRYLRLNGESLPTVLVMEEAHTFVKRYRGGYENQDTAVVCCQAFERIAREGRKFGLGLVISSQRPSELSPSVLSQCNSFLLHRISNDRDQELVGRLVPDNLRGLLRELPTLPSQNAILLGWASELPVLVRMNSLSREQQPRSDDAEFWNVWTRQEIRHVDWVAVADDWQGTLSPGDKDSVNAGSGQEKDPMERNDIVDDLDDLPF